MTPALSIVIPTFNGKSQLEANLPPLLEATLGRGALEMIIVDDGSTDGTPEFVARCFPEITLVALSRNRGFAGACNAGADSAKGEILYFLNSDVRVLPGSLDPVLEGFGDPTVFAVGSTEISPLGKGKLTVPVPFFRFGLFGLRYLEKAGSFPRGMQVFFVSAGHAAFSRQKFLSLGGFDDLYRPFYWEDIDLCYRAWRRGWKALLEPRSAVHHSGQGTIGRFYNRQRIQSIYWKNRFLFVWKNVRDAGLIAQHLACLPVILVAFPTVKGRAVLRGFAAALGQFGEVLRKRRQETGRPAISDREILNTFANRT
jgi:GT2 family glycosyltransferase